MTRQHILTKAHREVLRQFARSRALLAFDYDGTLAPIVDNPNDAELRASTRARLAKLTELYPCIVLSGRAHKDLTQRLRGLHMRELIGNHGAEVTRGSERHSRAVCRWRPLLEERLHGHAGVVVEDKVFSVAIHFRQSREKKRARAAILEAVAALGKVRIIGGKQVINVLPEGAPHKGIALERARARLECDTAIYVGDDETDEDVFALDQPGRLLSIRVGHKGSSNAAFHLDDQSEIDALLDALIELRSGGEVPRVEETDELAIIGRALDFMRLLWAVDHGLHRTSKRMATTLGITAPQRLVIRIVGRFPAISAGRLAEILHIHPSTLTGILERLEARGLVERRPDPRDARRAFLGLSSKGRELDREREGTIEAAIYEALSQVSDRQIEAARTVLGSIQRVLDAPFAASASAVTEGAGPRTGSS
jgi:trehalose-phosphatase